MAYSPRSSGLIFRTAVEAVGDQLSHADAVAMLERMPSVGQRLGHGVDRLKTVGERRGAGAGQGATAAVVAPRQALEGEAVYQAAVAVEPVFHLRRRLVRAGNQHVVEALRHQFLGTGIKRVGVG